MFNKRKRANGMKGKSSEFQKKYNEITTSLLNNMYREKNENIVFSPLSIYMLLAVMSHATDNNTRKEILKAISSDEGAEATLKELFNDIKEMTKDDALLTSNGIYFNGEIKDSVSEKYIEDFKRLFAGKIFATKSAKNEMNEWISEKSNGMINDFVTDDIMEALMCMFNVTAFETKWYKPYEEDQVDMGKFHNLDRSTSNVSMMNSMEHILVKNTKVKGIVKSYRNCDYSFMALLPNRKGKRALLSCINDLNLTDVFRTARDGIVLCMLPKFEYEFETGLKEFCMKSGISEIFSDNADFTPVTKECLKADKIIHKARIQVNEDGTRAAAITSMPVFTGIYREDEIKFDRPFIYAIMNNTTGLPAFVGVVISL